MATVPAMRRVKRSFTLTPESVAFLNKTRQQRGVPSDSETLDLLLRELIQESKHRELNAAYTAYYDTISEDALTEESEWAGMAGASGLLETEQDEVQL
jgi:hypothetical protein